MPRPSTDVSLPSVSDLPHPVVKKLSRDYPRRRCPNCNRGCFRNGRRIRRLHDVGDSWSGRPRLLEVRYSRHHCTRCGLHFPADLSDLGPPKGDYTQRVISLAIRCVIEDGLPYRTASWHLWRDHRVFVPFATIQNWVEGAGKKRRRTPG